ncbi:uncharacterized protein LOC141614097 [Silene latifolia]|uniref:uncharacterized protein LOC141614097 n=1 Tax=Silene latifolia TaxID=37657 RepID=UPI003D773F73
MSIDEVAKMLEHQDALTDVLKKFGKDKEAWVDFAKMSINIARFNPKEYMGTGVPILLDNWHREMENILNVVHCPEDFKVEQAMFYLRDAAGEWWDKVRESALDLAGLEVQPGYGCAVFSEALKKRFYPEEMHWQKEQDFLHLQKGSMTIEEYTNKFVKLSHFVTSVDMDEVSRTRRYEKNLAPKVRIAMSGIPSTSVQQAHDRALSIYD